MSNQARLGDSSTSPGRFAAESQGMMFGRSLVHTWTQTCLAALLMRALQHILSLFLTLCFTSCFLPVFPLLILHQCFTSGCFPPSYTDQWHIPPHPPLLQRQQAQQPLSHPTGPGAEPCWVLSTLQLHGLPARHSACNQLECPCHPGHSHSRKLLI